MVRKLVVVMVLGVGVLAPTHAFAADPVANPDTYSVRAETTLTVDSFDGLLANDTDADGDLLDVVSFSGPDNGTFDILLTTGAFTYTPNDGFVGTDTATYTVSDGDTSDVASITIEVTNQDPVANPDTYTMRANTTLIVESLTGVLANDTDPDGDLIQAVSFSAPDNGTFDAFITNGAFTYTPDIGFVGTDTATYTVSDGVTSDTATITIDVTNDDPVATPDTYTVRAETTLVVESLTGVLANDTDPDGDLIQAVSFSGPDNGTFDAFITTGAFTYTPDDGFVGTDTATYTVSDGVTSDTATITIDVTNDDPVATPDTYDTPADTTLIVESLTGVLANDTDPDGDLIQAVSFSGPDNGTFDAFITTGAFTYTPDIGFVGTDTATYTVSDGVTSDTATITINVGDVSTSSSTTSSSTTSTSTTSTSTSSTSTSSTTSTTTPTTTSSTSTSSTTAATVTSTTEPQPSAPTSTLDEGGAPGPTAAPGGTLPATGGGSPTSTLALVMLCMGVGLLAVSRTRRA